VSGARYPLASVQALRSDEEELAKRALSAAIDGHAAAERVAITVRERASAHDEQTARVRRDEEALDDAGRRVAEALTARAFLTRRKTERAQLAREVAEAEAQLRARAEAVERAREGLARARAEVEALAKHRAQWEAEHAKISERRAEAELDELAMRRR
jgi:hypothetical protein